MPKQTKMRNNMLLSRRWKMRLLAFAVLLALAGVFVALSLTVLFPATQCAVVGQSRYTAQDFAQAMELEYQRPNIFRADAASLVEKAEQALPYANIIGVTRQLPNTLRLAVAEHAPGFAQMQDELWWLIADTGRLLEHSHSLPEDVLVIRGADLMEPQPGGYAQWDGAFTQPGDMHQLIDALRDSGLLPHVTGLRISNYSIPDVIYQDRVRIRFGAASPVGGTEEYSLPEKLRFAQQALAELETQNPNYRGQMDLGAGRADFTPRWENDWQP